MYDNRMLSNLRAIIRYVNHAEHHSWPFTVISRILPTSENASVNEAVHIASDTLNSEPSLLFFV